MLLTIDAPSAHELKLQLVEICHSFGIAAVLPEAPIVPERMIHSPASSATRKPRSKPSQEIELPVSDRPVASAAAAEHAQPAAASEPASESSAESSAESPPAGAPPPNIKEQVFTALKALSTKKGLTTAKKVVESFKIGRISELPESQYQEFIKACDAAASSAA